MNEMQFCHDELMWPLAEMLIANSQLKTLVIDVKKQRSKNDRKTSKISLETDNTRLTQDMDNQLLCQ